MSADKPRIDDLPLRLRAAYLCLSSARSHDDELVGAFYAPWWNVNSSGRVREEPKDEIRRRLGRSPTWETPWS